MVSLSHKRKIFDPLRNRFVAASPEEIVRQTLIQRMLRDLGYPKERIVVEKRLDQMPHLSGCLPDRRADIVVFAPNIHPKYPFYPLLLIECKEEKITQKAIDQVLGYNYYLGAFFCALVAQTEMLCLLSEGKHLPHIPTYQELLAHASEFRRN